MHGKHKNSVSRRDEDETEALNSELMVTSGSDPNSMVSSIASTNNSVRRRKKEEEEEGDDDDKPVKDLLVYYARNSTMHGIPSIVGSKLYRGRNVFWIVIVCVMAMFLGTVVYWQMSDYYSYPTVTSIDISYVKHNDFPAITICDPNMFHQLFVDLTLDNFTMYQLAKLTEIEGFYYRFLKRVLKEEAPKPTNKSTVEYIQNLLDLSYHVIDSPDNLLYCSFGNYFWTVCPASRTRVTSMGVCSTVDVRKLVQEYESANVTVPKDGQDDGGGDGDGDDDDDDDDDDAEKEEELSAVGNAMRGLTLYIDTIPKDINYRLYQYQGFKLVLHDPDVEPLPQSEGVLVAGNTVVEIEVTKNVKHGLPAPYRAFGSVSCVDTEDRGFENPLQRYPNYTKEVCEHECFINFVVDFCGGCRHFLHPGNESICPLEHLSECYRDARTSYYGHSKKGQGAKKRCPCLMPCRQVNYKASVSTAPFVMTQYAKDRMNAYNMSDEFSLSYVHIYFSDPVVSTMKQVAIYSAEGLLGNIGGQIGLFMGFSLVTVAEMLELIFLLVSRGRTLDENVKLHNDAHAAAQAAAAQTAV